MYYPMICTTSEARSSSFTMSTSTAGSEYHRHHHHSSLSQPCLPVSNIGPTRILPFLFLGSQIDSLSKETMTQNGITYIINVSTSSPKPSFIPDGHFLRIPVNDNYCEKLTPYFNEAFQFLDKVREANGCVLIHCLAGISRSPTLAIAYVMRVLGMGTDEAYRYVKDKRPTISPNFNFLGQLLEFEQQLNAAAMSVARPDLKTSSFAPLASENSKFVVKKQRIDFDTAAAATAAAAKLNFELVARPSPCINSPTTALSLLNFNQLSPLREHPSPGIDSADRLGFSNADCGGPGIPVSSGGVVIRLGSKHCTLKRPLSIPLSPCLDVGCGNLTGNSVPDENAGNFKRTLPRPKSITLPATIQPASSRLLPGMHPSGGLTPVVPSGGHTPVGSHCPPVVQTETTSLFPLQNSSDKNMAQLRNAAKRMLLTLDTSHNLITDQHLPLAASHKSRSLEEMLTPDTVSPRPTAAGAMTLQVPCSSTGVTTGGDLPVYRCHEASSAETPHHPGSGLSSAGSHSSLLDSPEIISVS